MIFNTGECKMTNLQKAQKQYDDALEKYNKSHSTKDWNELQEAQEEVNKATTEWFEQNA